VFDALNWRLVGPFRAGRSVAVAGDPNDPLVFYFGGCAGGVFKTTDGGATWRPVSDGFLKTGSVGAIAVAESDPNVIYIGMGESNIRANVSHGDGVYRSDDAGETWHHLGLSATRHIGRIRVHPQNPDLVLSRPLVMLGDQTQNEASIGVTTADGPGNASCSSTTTPAPSILLWTRPTHGTYTLQFGKRNARPIVSSVEGQAAGSLSPSTAAIPGIASTTILACQRDQGPYRAGGVARPPEPDLGDYRSTRGGHFPVR
jgi:hypothetical protein